MGLATQGSWLHPRFSDAIDRLCRLDPRILFFQSRRIEVADAMGDFFGRCVGSVAGTGAPTSFAASAQIISAVQQWSGAGVGRQRSGGQIGPAVAGVYGCDNAASSCRQADDRSRNRCHCRTVRVQRSGRAQGVIIFRVGAEQTAKLLQEYPTMIKAGLLKTEIHPWAQAKGCWRRDSRCTDCLTCPSGIKAPHLFWR